MLQLLYLKAQGFKIRIHKDQFRAIKRSASESLELGEFVEPPAQSLVSVTYADGVVQKHTCLRKAVAVTWP